MALSVFDMKKPTEVAISEVKATDYDMGADDLFNKVAHSLSAQADRSYSDWAEAEQKKATEEGAVAGAQADLSKGPVPFKEGGTLVGESYNKAALNASLNKTKVVASSRLQELKQEHYNNPEAFKQASESYLQSIYKTMDEEPITKAYAPLLHEELNLGMKNDYYDVQKTARLEQVDKAKADLIDLDKSLSIQNRDAASKVYSGDVEQSKAALQQFYLNMQQKKNIYYSKDPETGRPKFTDFQIKQMEEEDTANFYEDAVESLLDNPNTSAQDIMKLKNGTYTRTVVIDGQEVVMNPFEQMGAERYDKSIKPLVKQKISERVAAQNKAEAEAEKAAKKQQDIRSFDYITNIKLKGGNIGQITNDLKNGVIDFETAKSARSAALSTTDISSIETCIEIQTGIDSGKVMKDFIIAHQDDLSPTDFKNYLIADGKHQSSQKAVIWKQDKKDYDKLYNPTNFMGTITNPLAIEQATINKRIYDNNIANGMAEPLAREYLMLAGEEVNSKMDAQEYQKVNSPYMQYNPKVGGVDMAASDKAIQDAIKTGDLTKEQAKEHWSRIKGYAEKYPNKIYRDMQSSHK